MPNNEQLTNAKRNKSDEFYTQYSTIEDELKHYEKHFHGKTVYCNCDDPHTSNFFRYFILNFNRLHLSRLICTCYNGDPEIGNSKKLFSSWYESKNTRRAYFIDVTVVYDIDGMNEFDNEQLLKSLRSEVQLLSGNGDFRSDECINYLKQADIVVTNPPFSLFREYIDKLILYGKQFIVLGNVNAISYYNVFPHIMNGSIRLGYSIHSGDIEFMTSDDYELDASGFRLDDFGNKYIRVKGIRWFTNIKSDDMYESFTFTKLYTPNDYLRYDNYDAIEVTNVSDIPSNYDGVMGVPITFIDVYNPDQFEILGITDRKNSSGLCTKVYTKYDGDNFNDLNARCAIRTDEGYRMMFPRILIKLKNP